MKKYLLFITFFLILSKFSYAQMNLEESLNRHIRTAELEFPSEKDDITSFAEEQVKEKKLQIPSCFVKFEYDKAIVDQIALKKCIETLDLSRLLYINIFATSSPEGGLAYNRKLSNRRALNIKRVLTQFNVPINIHNGGSSKEYGRQGTITFVVHKDNMAQAACPVVGESKAKIVYEKSPPKEVIREVTKEVHYKALDDLYVGFGYSFVSSPLSDYVGGNIPTYTVGISHKVLPLRILGGKSNFYLGGAFVYAVTNKILAETSTASKSSVRYVRNDYFFKFGVERAFQSLSALSLFAEAGPTFQERIFLIHNSDGVSQNAYASRGLGLNAALGLKFDFLKNSERLNKIGIDNLFTRLEYYNSIGPSMNTDSLTYGRTVIDINSFTWGALLSIGFSF